MMIPENVKSIYLIAVCGTGMASLAGLLKEAGFEVSGSDANIYPPMSVLLDNLNIPVAPGYKKENVPPDVDLVVVGNAVSKTNEEVAAVLESGLPYASFPETLAHFFLRGRKSLVVAGAHGKTTTTSLLSWVLHHAGRKPGFMVGGWMKNFDGNYRVPGGEFFVTEGDEYDTAFFDKEAKFLHYQPYAAILTGIEFDHADIFHDLAHMREAFMKFVGKVNPEGFLLVECETPGLAEIRKLCPARVETYGFSAEADWRVEALAPAEGVGQFRIAKNGNAAAAQTFQIPMFGKHNTLNAAATVAMTLNLGLEPEAVIMALHQFRGVKRRQEVVGEARGITVVDDFAHHPTAIALTLEGLRQAHPGKRVWAVFEPRSATSRRKVFQADLPPALGLADCAIIGPLFAPEKIPEEDRLDVDRVAEDIRNAGGLAWHLPATEAIVELIASEGRAGDLVVVMSSGGFDGIHQKLLARLKKDD